MPNAEVTCEMHDYFCEERGQKHKEEHGERNTEHHCNAHKNIKRVALFLCTVFVFLLRFVQFFVYAEHFCGII